MQRYVRLPTFLLLRGERETDMGCMLTLVIMFAASPETCTDVAIPCGAFVFERGVSQEDCTNCNVRNCMKIYEFVRWMTKLTAFHLHYLWIGFASKCIVTYTSSIIHGAIAGPLTKIVYVRA